MKIRFLVLALALMLSSATMAFAKSDHPFELNNATVEDLTSRCFFPQDLAEKVIELRDSMGGFQS